tara:strand:+ start:121 stop:378 length:258 start_codon:yes stop_codon:yes gene_type:complete
MMMTNVAKGARASSAAAGPLRVRVREIARVKATHNATAADLAASQAKANSPQAIETAIVAAARVSHNDRAVQQIAAAAAPATAIQ